MKVEYKYQDNKTTMFIESYPFAIIEKLDNALQITDHEGGFFDDQVIETELLERYVKDHIEQFPNTKLHADFT